MTDTALAGLSLETVAAIAAMAFAGTWSPGPNNALLSASGARFGFRATLPHARGVALGFPAMLFALAPSLLASVREVRRTLALSSVFVVCLYGGYFNGGLGIILLAALGLLGQRNLHSMNGVKNVLSAVLTSIAVLVYAAGDMVAWASFLPMALAAIVGGYAGAALAYRIPALWLRGGIVVVGLVMAAVFFLRLPA